MTTATAEEISLLESLDNEWIKLPLAVMRDVGPAVQTLGGLLKLTNRETFSPVSNIAPKARLPVGTVRKHLVALDSAGWISNRGREHTRRGRPRRTATLAITKKASGVIAPYAVLPWWACCTIRKVGKLPWSAKAVLSVVMARVMSLKAAIENDQGHMADAIEQHAEDVIANDDENDPDDPFYQAAVRREATDEGIEEMRNGIEFLGGEDRFRFSLDWLERQTGLHRESIVAAKRHLHRLGVVQWSGGPDEDGGDRTDLLLPNWDFRVVVKPASEGHVYLSFDRGSESE